MKKSGIFVFSLVILALACARPCMADSTPLPADRAALMELARQYVQKIGRGFKDADNYLHGMDAEDIRVQPFFDAIPEDEPLILQINLAREVADYAKIRIDQPVSAVKKGRDVLVSLKDFLSAADFPIKVDAEGGLAEGWFIRQSQTFHLDLKGHRLKINGNDFSVSSEDAIMQDDDILVKGKTLARWFGFRLITDLQTQSLIVVAQQRWPIQEKLERQARGGIRNDSAQPKQPFRKEPYQIVSTAPSTDIGLNQSVRRSAAGEKPSITTSYSIQTSGDLLGYSAVSTTGGVVGQGVGDMRINFSRTAENADLLGPMKARFYEFNDISTVNVPFTLGTSPERGFRATNKDPYITYDTTTRISGPAPPGWDVELYRGDIFISSGTVGNDGRYDFDKVTLFAGENNFKIIQYGPQGEIREETKTLAVAPQAFGGGGRYDISLSQQNTQTYTPSPSQDIDKGTPHLAATYEQQITQSVALQAGLQALQEDGNKHTYAHVGAVSVVKGAIINANAVAASTGSFLTALTARRNFNQHSVTGTLQYTSRNYNPGGTGGSVTPPVAQDIPAVTSLSGETTGPLYIGDKRVTYGISGAATYNDKGDSSQQGVFNLATSFGALSASNSTTWRSSTPRAGATAKSSTILTDSAAVRGRAFGLLWRASADYELSPQPGFKQYLFSLARHFSSNIEGQMDVRHTFAPDYTSGVVTLNYQLDRVSLSPSLSYDSSRALAALMNVRFGIGRNPYANDYVMTSSTMGDKGGVSVMVFLDKDGDNVFSEGDEFLEDVTVEAPQSQITANTDKNGEAYLYNLPITRITDIVVQDSSAFEVNWLPGTPGVSLRPRAGHVARVVFPIHRGGQMDGTTYTVSEEDGSVHTLGGMRLRLYDGDGKMVLATESASDGYYLFEKIPPGRYWLIADRDDAKDNHVMRPLPLQVNISFKGDALGGNDITFERGEADAGLVVAPDLSDYLAANPTLHVTAPSTATVVLNLGQYHSRLLATLIWYKLRALHATLVSDMEPVVKPAESNVSARTGSGVLRLLMKQGVTVQQAYHRCRRLSALGFPCDVELLPKGFSSERVAAVTVKG